MSWARIRVVVAGVLLAGWLIWLGYLAWSKADPVVVSRSQAMAATRFILADVTVEPDTGHPSRQVTVVDDLRPAGPPLARGQRITVQNIREARVAGGPNGFTGPGPYLLMLTPSSEADTFVLTPPPRAPGHEGAGRLPPWAYAWDAPGVREQFEALVPGRPPG